MTDISQPKYSDKNEENGAKHYFEMGKVCKVLMSLMIATGS